MIVAAAKRFAWVATIALLTATACAILALFVASGTLTRDVGTTVAAGIGSSLALLLGIVRDWQALYLPNRMVVVVSVIASS